MLLLLVTPCVLANTCQVIVKPCLRKAIPYTCSLQDIPSHLFPANIPCLSLFPIWLSKFLPWHCLSMQWQDIPYHHLFQDLLSLSLLSSILIISQRKVIPCHFHLSFAGYFLPIPFRISLYLSIVILLLVIL